MRQTHTQHTVRKMGKLLQDIELKVSTRLDITQKSLRLETTGRERLKCARKAKIQRLSDLSEDRKGQDEEPRLTLTNERLLLAQFPYIPKRTIQKIFVITLAELLAVAVNTCSILFLFSPVELNYRSEFCFIWFSSSSSFVLVFCHHSSFPQSC